MIFSAVILPGIRKIFNKIRRPANIDKNMTPGFPELQDF